MIFQMVVVCACVIQVLFTYCLCGEIMIDAYDISDDVYKLFWYRFDSKSKYIVWLMIARTQKPYHFASFQGINCSMETFLTVTTLTKISFRLENQFFTLVYRLFEKLLPFWLCSKAFEMKRRIATFGSHLILITNRIGSRDIPTYVKRTENSTLNKAI